MASINLIRSAEINYTAKLGDTFAPPPVSFSIDGTPESFAGCTLKMQIRTPVKLVVELTSNGGIAVNGSALQYSIADTTIFSEGSYKYDVQKTDGSAIVSTIQHGTINFIKDVTV
jgi:hypothetical protein